MGTRCNSEACSLKAVTTFIKVCQLDSATTSTYKVCMYTHLQSARCFHRAAVQKNNLRPEKTNERQKNEENISMSMTRYCIF